MLKHLFFARSHVPFVELWSPDGAVLLRMDSSFAFILFPTNSCVSACSAQTAVALQIIRIRAFFFFINRC